LRRHPARRPLTVFDLNVGVGKVKKHGLRAPQSIAFLKPSPLGSTYFLPTAAKTNHKFIWDEFEHLKDGA
jgi:hypothetical protein